MNCIHKTRGNFNELGCMAHFSKYGCILSQPYGDSAPYDFIADVGGRLLKIQCKSWDNCATSGCIRLSFKRTTMNSKGTVSKYYSVDEVDYFATVWDNKCYIIKNMNGLRGMTLRVIRSEKTCCGNAHSIEEFGIDSFMNKFGLVNNEKVYIDANEPSSPFAKEYVCRDCGKKFIASKNHTNRCDVCISNNRARVDMPDRNHLEEDVRTMKWVDMEKKYGVSSLAIKKWCRKFGIVIPKYGRGRCIGKRKVPEISVERRCDIARRAHLTIEKRMSEGKKYNWHTKKVASYSKEGDLIKVYSSIQDAERDGFNHSNVGRVCRGERESHKGLKWKFL